ncbi:MAG: DNA polymerase III subunit beta [Candidatus Buchananbacteria bacterium]|nr:DNA polymerase III subunit beta [Candidatus Buchananbacteria bacterium]
MKISCTQENLNQGLFIVSHLANKNVALPILNNILFQVKDNAIKLSATNLEIGISCTIRGKVEQEGEFTVQSKLLADFVSLLPKERVDLQASEADDQDQILKIDCKNDSTKIKGQAATDFPLIPQVEKNAPYLINHESFRQALGQVLFAVSVNETRPEIGGVLFNFSDNKLTLAATDSYRLAEKSLEFKRKNGDSNRRIIVPAKTLQELQRILGSLKDPASISDIEEVEIYISDNQIMFVLGNIELVSRLVEGQYPDYQQIIPQETKTKVLVETADFVKAIKTAGLFSRIGIYDVKVDILPGQNQLKVAAINSQLGENISELEAEIQGEVNSTVLNFRFLLDGLQNINTQKTEIDLVDSGNPCLLRPEGAEKDYLYIVMPIKQ